MRTINRFKKALDLLKQAENEWREIEQSDAGLITYDAAYFADEVSQIISCDNGEAGLKKLVENLDRYNK